MHAHTVQATPAAHVPAMSNLQLLNLRVPALNFVFFVYSCPSYTCTTLGLHASPVIRLKRSLYHQDEPLQ